MKAFLLTALGGTLLVILGCVATVLLIGAAVAVFFPVISDEEVKREFLISNPGSKVKEVFVGEGWGDTAFFHIVHTTASGEERAAVWVYVENDDKWKVTHKEVGAVGTFDD